MQFTVYLIQLSLINCVDLQVGFMLLHPDMGVCMLLVCEIWIDMSYVQSSMVGTWLACIVILEQ